MRSLALACCKLYISESRNARAMDSIARAATGHSQAPLLHIFTDSHYNRVGYTLAGSLRPSLQALEMEDVSKDVGNGGISSSSSPRLPLHSAVVDIVKIALEQIDLQEHSGSHPRLGVVDHLCFHPLGAATLPIVASLAQSVARDIGLALEVPTYLYGAAHPEGRPLDAIRRALGYFRPDAQGQWVGAPSLPLSLIPDFGAAISSSKSGVVVVGACPWIANYNIPVLSNDLDLGRRIARKVSARGGGLPAVQAMALLHGHNGMEIACNLMDCRVTCADLVQEEVARLAEKQGLTVEGGYFTDYSEDEITEMASLKLLSRE